MENVPTPQDEVAPPPTSHIPSVNFGSFIQLLKDSFEIYKTRYRIFAVLIFYMVAAFVLTAIAFALTKSLIVYFILYFISLVFAFVIQSSLMHVALVDTEVPDMIELISVYMGKLRSLLWLNAVLIVMMFGIVLLATLGVMVPSALFGILLGDIGQTIATFVGPIILFGLVVLLAVRVSFTLYVFVDQKKVGLAALTESWRLVKGSTWKVVLYLVGGILAMILLPYGVLLLGIYANNTVGVAFGVLALLVIYFVSTPILIIFTGRMYKILVGRGQTLPEENAESARKWTKGFFILGLVAILLSLILVTTLIISTGMTLYQVFGGNGSPPSGSPFSLPGSASVLQGLFK